MTPSALALVTLFALSPFALSPCALAQQPLGDGERAPAKRAAMQRFPELRLFQSSRMWKLQAPMLLMGPREASATLEKFLAEKREPLPAVPEMPREGPSAEMPTKVAQEHGFLYQQSPVLIAYLRRHWTRKSWTADELRFVRAVSELLGKLPRFPRKLSFEEGGGRVQPHPARPAAALVLERVQAPRDPGGDDLHLRHGSLRRPALRRGCSKSPEARGREAAERRAAVRAARAERRRRALRESVCGARTRHSGHAASRPSPGATQRSCHWMAVRPRSSAAPAGSCTSTRGGPAATSTATSTSALTGSCCSTSCRGRPPRQEPHRDFSLRLGLVVVRMTGDDGIHLPETSADGLTHSSPCHRLLRSEVVIWSQTPDHHLAAIGSLESDTRLPVAAPTAGARTARRSNRRAASSSTSSTLRV